MKLFFNFERISISHFFETLCFAFLHPQKFAVSIPEDPSVLGRSYSFFAICLCVLVGCIVLPIGITKSTLSLSFAIGLPTLAYCFFAALVLKFWLQLCGVKRAISQYLAYMLIFGAIFLLTFAFLLLPFFSLLEFLAPDLSGEYIGAFLGCGVFSLEASKALTGASPPS